ncbi:hypothetical protein EYB45_06425 [Erythrobacteraceae bacterium CFH 75059]|uniref:hypothetical protein n=1 Tax=Qipengyuania thermophila TaxID=2509361 RepID=UPI00102126FB|nr:hypothetical protein [Qipengyuania thermophila]TCD05136.1 hypothetical protein EYB45_06425 [Erythrobacteraceae bacterium CFH 75059]
MTDDLARRLGEERRARDSAYAAVQEDIALLKAGHAEKGIKDRATDKIKDGASDVLEEGAHLAREHKGLVVALLAAIVVWFARHPLIAFFTGERSDEDEDVDDWEPDERERSAFRFRN